MVVVIWELGRTLVTSENKTISPYQMALLPLTRSCYITMFFFSFLCVIA